MITRARFNRRQVATLITGALAVFSLSTRQANALTGNAWIGSQTDVYNNANNWSNGNIPDITDQANIFAGPVTLYANPATVGGLLVSSLNSSNPGQFLTGGFKYNVSGNTAIDVGGQLFIQYVTGGGTAFTTGNLTVTSGSLVNMQYSNSAGHVTGNLTVDATSKLEAEGTLTVGGTYTNNGTLQGGFTSTISTGTFTLSGTAAHTATIDANFNAMTINATSFNLSNTNSTIDLSDSGGSLDLEGNPTSNVGATVTIGDSSSLSFGSGFWSFGYYTKSGIFFVPNGSVNLNGGGNLAHAALIDSGGTYNTTVNVTGYGSMVGAEFDGASSINVASGGFLYVGSPNFRGTSFSSSISLLGAGTYNFNNNTTIGFTGSGIPYTIVSVAAGTIFNWEGTSGGNATLDIENGELDIAATSIQNRSVFNGIFFTQVNGYDGNMTVGGGSTLNVSGAPWTLFGTMTLEPGALVAGQTLTIKPSSSLPAGTYSLNPVLNGSTTFPVISAPVVLAANAVIFMGFTGGLHLDGNTTYAGGQVISAPYVNTPYGVLVQDGNATVSGNTTILCNTLDMDGTANTATWTINPGVTFTQQAFFLDSANSTINPFHSTLTINGGTLSMQTSAGQWTLAGGTLNLNQSGTSLPIVTHDKLILGNGFTSGSIVVGGNTTAFISGGLQSGFNNAIALNSINVGGNSTLFVGPTFGSDANAILTKTGAGLLVINGTQSHGAGALINVLQGELDLNTDAGSAASSTLSIAVNGGNLHLDTIQHLGALTITSGLASLITGTTKANSLTFAGSTGNWTGSLDLTTQKLIIEASASHTTALNNAKNQAFYSRTHAAGISSSNLAANQVIAVVDNAVANFSTFGGLPVDTSSILATVALDGDANLDGVVNISDLNALAAHWQQSPADWTQGDFNGDGVVNIADLNVIAVNWQAGSGSGSGESSGNAIASLPNLGIPSSVPEPGSLSVLGVGGLLLARMRRSASRQ